MDLYPTHSCFDDAFEFINDAIMLSQEPLRTEHINSLILVHGICLLSNGAPYAHAWVERSGQCIFKGILEGEASYFAGEQKEFYDEHKVQETTKYTVIEAAKENKRTGHLGPWVQRYRELCKKKQHEQTKGQNSTAST